MDEFFYAAGFKLLDWLWTEFKPLILDRDPLPAMLPLNRRLKVGFRWNRASPDPHPDRFRACDGKGPWPSFRWA